MRKENTITYRVCNIKIYQTYLHPILSYIIIYYLCAMPNFKWCSLGIFKKTKCRNIATEVQLDLPGAWLSWPPKPSCGRKRRLCEDPSRTCQEHFPPRRIPGRQRVWGDTLDTLPTSDCNIAMTMSSKNINLCQIKVFLSNNSSYTQAFLNYLNQKKLIKDINPIKTPCFLAIIFPPHQSILKPSPPPKKKVPPPLPAINIDPTLQWHFVGCVAETLPTSRRPREDPRRCAARLPRLRPRRCEGNGDEAPVPGRLEGGELSFLNFRGLSLQQKLLNLWKQRKNWKISSHLVGKRWMGTHYFEAYPCQTNFTHWTWVETWVETWWNIMLLSLSPFWHFAPTKFEFVARAWRHVPCFLGFSREGYSACGDMQGSQHWAAGVDSASGRTMFCTCYNGSWIHESIYNHWKTLHDPKELIVKRPSFANTLGKKRKWCLWEEFISLKGSNHPHLGYIPLRSLLHHPPTRVILRDQAGKCWCKAELFKVIMMLSSQMFWAFYHH